MKRKTQKLHDFIDGMNRTIINDPQFRKDITRKNEKEIQTEIRPILLKYLRKHFEKEGIQDVEQKANKSFYWEGQEGQYGKQRDKVFGARSYPDFIIEEPYLIAVEYKQGEYGSSIKHGIGQALLHTMSGDFDYAYLLFRDESKDDEIYHDSFKKTEENIMRRMWEDFNVYIDILPFNIEKEKR